MTEEWITKNPSIVVSSISRDIILLRHSITCKKSNNVAEYLIQISLRELHNDLIKGINEGGLSEVWKETNS